MNDDLRKATDRIEQLEKTVKKHTTLLAKVWRIVWPLRQARERIEVRSKNLTGWQAKRFKSEMAGHGYPDPDDDETPNPNKKYDIKGM